MKKISKFLAAAGIAAMAAVMPMTSYAFNWDTKKETEAAAEISYIFKTDKATISIGTEAEAVIRDLGTPEKTFEQDSCAYQGKDKVYTYDGFEVSTHMLNGKEIISSVYLINDKAETPEGIKIGSKKQDVINTYGEEYKEEFGVYRYTAGNTELAVYTTDGVVDSIEYLLLVK